MRSRAAASLLLALLLALGCGGSAEPATARTSGAGARAKAAAPATEAALTMPRPAPLGRRDGDALARNAECEACHQEVADEWRGSLHAEAFTVREFAHAFQSEPLPFCRGCHAPEAGPARDPAAEALGVACVTCHLPVGERVLAAPRAGAPASEAAPHPLARAPRFASDDACAGCHEFTFPDNRPVPEYMQTTVREHRRSPAAARPCASCHMPERPGGGRSHAFHASRDAAWMRGVVAIAASRPRADEVEIRLELDVDAVGHALPTGDLFRQISVEAISTRRRLRPATVRRTLARHWAGASPGSIHRREVADDRLGVGDNPRIVRLTLDPADAALAVRWRVRYERVESLLGADAQALVVGGVVLGEGVLAAPGDDAGGVSGESDLRGLGDLRGENHGDDVDRPMPRAAPSP